MSRVTLDVDSASGPQQGAQERDQHGREQRREEARQDGRHVLDHALLRLYQPGDTGIPAAPHGSSHDSMNGSGSIPMLSNSTTMNAVRTPPPRAIST